MDGKTFRNVYLLEPLASRSPRRVSSDFVIVPGPMNEK